MVDVETFRFSFIIIRILEDGPGPLDGSEQDLQVDWDRALGSGSPGFLVGD